MPNSRFSYSSGSDSESNDQFYDAPESLDSGYESAEPSDGSIIPDDRWEVEILQMSEPSQNLGDRNGRVLQILRTIGHLPRMAATIQRKAWFVPTIELVLWLVRKRENSLAVDNLDRASRREQVRNGQIHAPWFLFGGPVSLPTRNPQSAQLIPKKI